MGHGVTVIGGDPARMTAALGEHDIKFVPAVTTLDVAKAIAPSRRPDVLHAHMTAAELAAVLTRPLVRAPIVVTRHFARSRGSSPASRLLGKAIRRTVTAQISISRFVADHVDGPSTIIHLGTSTPTLTVRAHDRNNVVLVAQRFEPEKRTDLALRVWAASHLGDRGWLLRLAGDGSLRRDLEQQARDLEIQNSCEFLGYQSDLATLFARSAIFLAPGPNEGFGLSVIEAMSYATPVVAAAEGGHAETVGASPAGRLYPAEDTAMGGRLLAELAANRQELAAYGHDLRHLQKEEFSTAAMVAATVDFYRSIA